LLRHFAVEYYVMIISIDMLVWGLLCNFEHNKVKLKPNMLKMDKGMLSTATHRVMSSLVCGVLFFSDISLLARLVHVRSNIYVKRFSCYNYKTPNVAVYCFVFCIVVTNVFFQTPRPSTKTSLHFHLIYNVAHIFVCIVLMYVVRSLQLH